MAPLWIALFAFAEAKTGKIREPVLRRLNVGATKPKGWLMDELNLQSKGLSGTLPYEWNYLTGSKWTGGDGPPSHQSNLTNTFRTI